jgi:hypothetical protein
MKAVCIGGPIDGNYHEIEDGGYRFHVVIKDPLYFKCELSVGNICPIERACSEHWYTLKSFYILGKTIYFFDYDNRTKDYIDCSSFFREIVGLFNGDKDGD